jgi:hypothetical protein
MHQKIEGRMETPTLRVEERKPNEIQGAIETDADMQGDCCSQFKEALMSDFIGQLDEDPDFKDSDYELDGWNYQKWITEYESAMNRQSCEDIIEELETHSYSDKMFLSRIKPAIDAYHSCNFGADSSAKYAMHN